MKTFNPQRRPIRVVGHGDLAAALQITKLAAALMIAIRVHAAQRDKQDEPYLLHVLRVVEAVSDEARTAAALHDAFEDGDWPSADDATAALAPFDKETIEALDYLTHTPELTYSQYIERIATGPSWIAREVKLADLRDHLSRMPESAEWQSLRTRYTKAKAVLKGSVDA